MSNETESEGPSSSYQANLQRGELLCHQSRHADAEKYLQQAIGEQPSNAEGYYQLSFCYCNWKGHIDQAMQAINRALSLDPSRAEFYALRSWILGNKDKDKESLEVAFYAISLNPFDLLALNARTRAYSSLCDWQNAEASARSTLELYAQNELAATFLSEALRRQGRNRESEEVSAGLLSRVPNNSMAQCSAGWAALEAGGYQRANQHFMEALRLDPNSNNARQGLLHSFNSRVWVYRFYFQFVAWLSRFQRGMQWMFFILIYIVYRVIQTELSSQFGNEGLHWGLVLAAVYLVLFGFGRSFGNFFLMLDPFARYALTWKERAWSCLAAAIYGFFLTVEILDQAWPQAAVLVGILLFFLCGVLIPLFQDKISSSSVAR